MRVALVVPELTSDVSANLSGMKAAMLRAAEAGARLVVFPEATLTGLVNNDDPRHDLPLGQTIPGPATEDIAAMGVRLNVWTALGLLEKDGGELYDSAALIDPSGNIRLKYRRIQPQWHGRAADPSIYRQGSSVGKAETPFGVISFLICGDMFDDAIISQLRAAKPDLVLFPFARCFSSDADPQKQWDEKEQEEYTRRVRLLGKPTLMTNYLAPRELNGGAFGGAFAVAADGTVTHAWPLCRAGTLHIDMRSS